MKKNIGKGGHCFIATAAFGSEISNEVITLKLYRDKVLINNAIGRAFIKTYYRLSPPIANLIRKKPQVRALVRFLLKPIIRLAKKKI